MSCSRPFAALGRPHRIGWEINEQTKLTTKPSPKIKEARHKGVQYPMFDVGFLFALLRIARRWSLEKFATLTLKPRSHVRILIYQKWAIDLPGLIYGFEEMQGY